MDKQSETRVKLSDTFCAFDTVVSVTVCVEGGKSAAEYDKGAGQGAPECGEGAVQSAPECGERAGQSTTGCSESAGQSAPECGERAGQNVKKAAAGEEAAQRAFQELRALCERYEQLFSRTISSSDVSRINTAGGKAVCVAPETAQLIAAALQYCKKSNGVFDITAGCITPLWDFKQGICPGEEALQQALCAVGWHGVHVFCEDNNSEAGFGESSSCGASFGETSKRGADPSGTDPSEASSHKPGSCESDTWYVQLENPQAALDLGGIAKGWIADELGKHLLQAGFSDFLINLGGNILTHGHNAQSKPWIVEVINPFAHTGAGSRGESACSEPAASPACPSDTSPASESAASPACAPTSSAASAPIASPTSSPAKILIESAGTSVVTSGTYERCFAKNGVLLHHILDPRTGRPVVTDAVSATIVCEKSLDAEGFSTAALALGVTAGTAFCRAQPEILAAYFIDIAGRVSSVLPGGAQAAR